MLPQTPQDDRGTTPVDLLLLGDDAAVAVRWRGLGRPADLDLNLRGVPRSDAVTEVLARCRSGAGRDLSARRRDARRMTIAGRIGGLAVIVSRTTGSEELAVWLRCPDVDCREDLQVGLSVDELLDLSRRAESERWLTFEAGGESIRVRRPTGEDQLAWQSAASTYPSAAAAEEAMAASLVQHPHASVLPPAAFPAIDAALEQSDPLTCFRIETTCPACGRTGDHAVDLEALLLGHIQRAQRALLGDIHTLATHYGWSERAIAAMPAWRRRVYLELLEREAP